MTLDINIDYGAKPIIKEVNRSSIIKKFLFSSLAKVLETFLKKRLSRLNSKLDTTILTIEGSHKYLKELHPSEANDILAHIKKSAVDFEKAYNNLEQINFFDDKVLKLKFKHLLKSLYKSEAIAHKITYKEKETLKTDDVIKDGIIKMNSNFYKKTV